MNTISSPRTVLINRKQLLKIIPLSDRTIFEMEKRGEFPHRFALTSRAVAWDLQEVEAWVVQQKNAGRQCSIPQFSRLV